MTERSENFEPQDRYDSEKSFEQAVGEYDKSTDIIYQEIAKVWSRIENSPESKEKFKEVLSSSGLFGRSLALGGTESFKELHDFTVADIRNMAELGDEKEAMFIMNRSKEELMAIIKGLERVIEVSQMESMRRILDGDSGESK